MPMGYGGKAAGILYGNGRRTNRAEAAWEDIYQSGKGICRETGGGGGTLDGDSGRLFYGRVRGRFFDERVFSGKGREPAVQKG